VNRGLLPALRFPDLNTGLPFEFKEQNIGIDLLGAG
jgi:hypothetical protein